MRSYVTKKGYQPRVIGRTQEPAQRVTTPRVSAGLIEEVDRAGQERILERRAGFGPRRQRSRCGRESGKERLEILFPGRQRVFEPVQNLTGAHPERSQSAAVRHKRVTHGAAARKPGQQLFFGQGRHGIIEIGEAHLLPETRQDLRRIHDRCKKRRHEAELRSHLSLDALDHAHPCIGRLSPDSWGTQKRRRHFPDFLDLLAQHIRSIGRTIPLAFTKVHHLPPGGR